MSPIPENTNPFPLLGVLGGMGPLATVDFLAKLIEEAGAERDEDHVPVVVYSVPQIPSRPAAIIAGGASPLPAMAAGAQSLRRAGATTLAIACNTAHYWYDALESAAGLPILHIADATLDAMEGNGHLPGTVGLIGTKGTIEAGFFQERFAGQGIACVLNSAEEQDSLVLPAIAAVKRHALDVAHALAVQACERLVARGAQTIVLGCTEIPPALEFKSHAYSTRCIDPTRALAQACVAWWRAARKAS